MTIITPEMLKQLKESARTAPRLRRNLNLHRADGSACHRLLNAIEPESYIRPHRHLDPEKDEAFVLISGRLGVIRFSDSGEMTEAVVMSRESGILVVDIPSGVFHTAVSLEPGTVFFEAKAGPYLPLTADETAPWSPPDGDPSVEDYLFQLKALLIP